MPYSLPMDAYRITHHARTQADAKGFSIGEVQAAAMHPTITYANGRFPSQMRHIRGNVVAIVDVPKRMIVTVYSNVVETPLRPDQTDADALAYGKRKGK